MEIFSPGLGLLNLPRNCVCARRLMGSCWNHSWSMNLNTRPPGTRMMFLFLELWTLTRNINLFLREGETGPTVPLPSGNVIWLISRKKEWIKNVFRHLSNDDAGNYKVVVKNKHGEKANHVRLSMKDENAPKSEGIEPTFFRKPTSRQEGKKLHLECEIEALPKPEIFWFLGDQSITDSDKYCLFRAIQPSNPNIHFVRLTINVSFLQANYETTSSFTYLL